METSSTRHVTQECLPGGGRSGSYSNSLRDGVPTVFDFDLQTLIEEKEVAKPVWESVQASSQVDESALEFASALAHDLRSPLAAITLFFSVLKIRYGDVLDERTLAHMHRAEGVVERTAELVQEHLDQFSGRSKLEVEDVDMSTAVDDVLENLEARIEDAHATVQVGSLPVVQGHLVQLRQLMQNLIENALAHAGRDGPVIRIEAQKNENQWVFQVSDDGKGFDPEEAERLFQKAHKGAGGKADGCGLGLTLCREIVTRHGGEIWAESRVGDGSRFSFTLPISA